MDKVRVEKLIVDSKYTADMTNRLGGWEWPETKVAWESAVFVPMAAAGEAAGNTEK
jgi:hypothetical protein